MPNNELLQSMYSPLSQNMTDSESDEDLHLHRKHHLISGRGSQASGSIVPNGNGNGNGGTKNNKNKMIGTNCGGGGGGGHPALTAPMHEINCSNYTHLNSDGEDGRFHHHHHMTDADNVCILDNDDSNNSNNNNSNKTRPMGPIRRILFILSIVICILTVILFLWIIPCSENGSCPARSERRRTENWFRNYEKIEFKGAINVVAGLRGRSKNLIFMYRGNKLFNEFERNPNRKRNGIISLIGHSGQVAWYDEMINEPKIIDCTLIDADKNGSPDCLVVDEFGEIGCINPVSGEWIWHVAERTTKSSESLSFPLILPDLNQDGVNELLVAATANTQMGLFNHLKMVSGADGQTIGRPLPMQQCSLVHKFQLDRNYKISFNCLNNETEVQIIKSLPELYRLITNRAVDLAIRSGKGSTRSMRRPINQHKYYGQRKDTVSQRNIYSVSGKQLIVENYGKCPENCNVSVQLTEQKSGHDIIIRQFNGSRMYGMVPATLSFNNTNVHGFVLKFWEWSLLNETDIHFQARHRRSTFNTEYNRFADVLIKKETWKMPQPKQQFEHNNEKYRFKRDTNKSTKSFPLKTITNFIKETVVLIVFNSTDIRIENTSQSNIIQFCKSDDDNNTTDQSTTTTTTPITPASSSSSTYSCQPDLNYQENSLLIADLDADNSQELVSYYSTFLQTDDEMNVANGNRNSDGWHLVTYVHLLRLESELPKLYTNVIAVDHCCTKGNIPLKSFSTCGNIVSNGGEYCCPQPFLVFIDVVASFQSNLI